MDHEGMDFSQFLRYAPRMKGGYILYLFQKERSLLWLWLTRSLAANLLRKEEKRDPLSYIESLNKGIENTL